MKNNEKSGCAVTEQLNLLERIANNLEAKK
jgi:hypothetical protein